MKNTNLTSAFQRVFSIAIIAAATAISPLCAQELIANQDGQFADGIAFNTPAYDKAIEPTAAMNARPSFAIAGQYANVNSYIAEHLEYPDVAYEIMAEGLLRLKLEIKSDGSVGEVIVLRSPGVEFEDAVKALLNDMPKWNPAVKNGKAVDGAAILQLRFRLQ